MHSAARSPAVLQAGLRGALGVAPSAAVAVAPARSFFTHLHARTSGPCAPLTGAASVAASARSSTLLSPAPASAPLSAPRRFYSEPKIKRVRQAWEPEEEEKMYDARGRELSPEDAAVERERIAKEKEEARLEMERTRTKMTFLEDRQKGTRDQEEIKAFLTKLKLQEHAEKFFSMQNLLNISVRELKVMGLTVKQRKMLLRLLNQYKLALRVQRANALIMEQGDKMDPRALQQAVYDIMYVKIYDELAWREAKAPLIHEWREKIHQWRHEHIQDHSNLRGLREPDLMEIAKVEANMMQETLKWKRAGYVKVSEKLASIKGKDTPAGLEVYTADEVAVDHDIVHDPIPGEMDRDRDEPTMGADAEDDGPARRSKDE